MFNVRGRAGATRGCCGVLGLALWGAQLSGCGAEAAAEVDLSFPVGPPRVETVAVVQEYPANLAAVRYAELRSRVDGVIESVHVDEGQRVDAGAPVFAINAALLRQAEAVATSTLRKAEAELSAARLERDNAARLQQGGVVADTEVALADARVDAAGAALEEARASAQLARLQRELATVRAPFGGVINRLPRRVGSTVGAQELLTSISDTSEVFAYFRLSEREALEWERVQPDMTSLRLVTVDGREHPHAGSLDATGAELDTESRTLLMRARVPNPDGALRHGGTARVRLQRDLPNAVLVPQAATRDVQGNLYVYVVGADAVPVARRIEAARRVGMDFVVDSGLAPGERVVLDGIQKLREGEPIRAQTTAREG